MVKRTKQILFFVLVLFLFACNGDKASQLADSTGNINEISIVVNDVLWNGEVGDQLRKKLAAPVDGLSQEEPLFTLNQYHEQTFNDVLKQGRNIIIIDKEEGRGGFSYKQNGYCSHQNVFTIRATTIDGLLKLIQMHSDEMIRVIRKTEMETNQRNNDKVGIIRQSTISKEFGITIKVPVTYRQVLKQQNFLWLKKDIPSGNTNLVLYKVPLYVIEKDKDILNNIVHMRDSIGSTLIHGKEAGTYMGTEAAFAPSLYMTGFQDKRAFETRGNWEMKGDFMNGPFINYAIMDPKQKCYLIIEGFIYSPSSPKRDLIVELESIINSTRFL